MLLLFKKIKTLVIKTKSILKTREVIPKQGGVGGAELFPCPYPLKVQERPPQDEKLASQSKVLGQGSKQNLKLDNGWTQPFYYQVSLNYH